MILPTVHLNGSSAETLAAQARAAIVAGRLFETALCEASPNGRDYYPQGDDAATQARDEHAARLQKVRDVVAEMQDVYDHIMAHRTRRQA